jgi:hypothetical protein
LMVILMGFVRIETSFFVNGIQWVLWFNYGI